jgi:hypothetical protein
MTQSIDLDAIAKRHADDQAYHEYVGLPEGTTCQQDRAALLRIAEKAKALVETFDASVTFYELAELRRALGDEK